MGNEKEMIIHIDCNTFYASCEVALRPDLQGKPVVVANCNEAGGGIILALTQEAKALGLKRGNPIFQVKDVINKNNVAVFHANLPKYVDISRRLMQIVKEQDIVLNFKQYSVDEFFGELPISKSEELYEYGLKVKKHIEQCTGIPVSCGISLTYTLAKVATWYAKHYKGYRGVCVLAKDNIEVALKKMPIADVWGIGRKSAPKLESKGITNALQFYSKPEYNIRKMLNINGIRTWKELHGTPSVEIENPTTQKSLVHSRTFTYMTTDLQILKEYITEYAMAAARKLRDQHSVCLNVSAFICTNPHRDDQEQYRNIATSKLNVATADSLIISKAATEALEKIFKQGYHYKKAGVMLTNITTDDAIQLDLFCRDSNELEKSKRLMSALDSITTRFGMDSVKVASQGFKDVTHELTNIQPMRNETTNIDDIIKVITVR